MEFLSAKIFFSFRIVFILIFLLFWFSISFVYFSISFIVCLLGHIFQSDQLTIETQTRAHTHSPLVHALLKPTNKSWILLSVYGFVFISFNRMPFLLQSKIKLIDMVSNKCFQTDRTMTQPIKTILWNDRDVSLSGFYHSGIMYIAVAWIFN